MRRRVVKVENDTFLRPERLGGTSLHLASVGPALRRIRQVRGLTQRDLAQRAGLTPAMVSSYERGKRLPSLRSLSYLLGALNAHLWHLERTAYHLR